MKGDWRVEHHRAGAAELHALGVPEHARRSLRWYEPERPALVLGSAQPEAHVDLDAAAAAGIEVVRRRSGGGAVLVRPGDLFWCDVVVPAGDPLWSDDVGKAFHWVGRAFARALDEVGVAGLAVHEGALVSNEWSRMVCFAGLGPGEVLTDGRKVVGMSQRRTRRGAVFQIAVFRQFDVQTLPALLQLTPDRREALETFLRSSVASVPSLPQDALESAVLAAIETAGPERGAEAGGVSPGRSARSAPESLMCDT